MDLAICFSCLCKVLLICCSRYDCLVQYRQINTEADGGVNDLFQIRLPVHLKNPYLGQCVINYLEGWTRQHSLEHIAAL